MQSVRDLEASLPKLPGHSFHDKIPIANSRNKAQGFTFVNGMPVVKSTVLLSPSAAPASPLPPSRLSPTRSSPLMGPSDGNRLLMNRSVVSGPVSSPMRSPSPDDTIVSQLPGDNDPIASVPLERMVLRFYAYTTENVTDSNFETFRYRYFTIYYYVQDNTVKISEPRSENSGIPQGVALKRRVVPGVVLPLFNVGNDVEVCGQKYKIYDCDGFTRRFLTERLSLEVPAPLPRPEGSYDALRRSMRPENGMGPMTEETRELKRFFESAHVGRVSFLSTKEKEDARRYLDNDRKVLRFYAVWDDRDSLHGDYRYFTIYYFLKDETVEVTEQVPPNAGRDPVGIFVSKQRIPKTFHGLDSFSDHSDHFLPKDFRIGSSTSIYHRSLFIYDCDAYTREYLTKEMGISADDLKPVAVGVPAKPKPVAEPPPHNGFGDEVDSLNNWKNLILKPPKKDFVKLMKHEKDKMRFEARLVDARPEDADRRFIITYHVADDTISIYEPPVRNSGVIGGKFLERRKVATVSKEEMFVGSQVVIMNFKFQLTTTDEATLKFMESRPKEFTLADVNYVLQRLQENILRRHVRLRDAFRSVDTDHSGAITFNEFKKLCDGLQMNLLDQEVITVFRHFDQNQDGIIGYRDFVDVFQFLEDPSSGGSSKNVIGQQEFLTAQTREFMEAAKKREDEDRLQMLLNTVVQKFQGRFDRRRLYFVDCLRIACDASHDNLLGEPELRLLIRKDMRIGQQDLGDEELSLLCQHFFPPAHPRLTRTSFLQILEGRDPWSSSSHLST